MARSTAVVAVVGAIATIAVMLVKNGSKERVELLERTNIRSPQYYLKQAAEDRSQPYELAKKGRIQSLANWQSGALAGTANLVEECSHGNNDACNELAANPAAMHALQGIDDSNPKGFSARHPRSASNLRAKVNKDFKRTRRVSPRFQSQARVPEPLSYYGKNLVPAQLKNYKTSKSTKNEWDTPAWKKGSLTNPRNSAWLKACGEGNFYACKHISSFDDSIHDLLHPRHKYNFMRHKTERPLSPVYVVQKPQSFFGTIMHDLGLSDSYVSNDFVDDKVAAMRPDSGLFNQGKRKVYNDGTVASVLSDEH